MMPTWLFLSSYNQELGGDVVLVAHKCLDYDAKVSIDVFDGKFNRFTISILMHMTPVKIGAFT